MNYVEFLHVVRNLRNLGIILGALVVLALIGRPFSHDHGQDVIPNDRPVQTEHRADGTMIQRYTSGRGNHVTVETDPRGAQTITVISPARPAHRATHIRFGPVNVEGYNRGKNHISVVKHDPRIPAGTLFLIAAMVGAIVAAIFGLALSRENDGHLELAWTKPASRLRYALGAVAMDTAGAVAAAVMTLVTIVLVLAIYGEAGHIVIYPDSWIAAVFSIAFALSFYGIIVAVTASLRGAAATGAFAVLFPVMFLLPVFSGIRGNVGTIVRAVDTINPNAYFYNFAGGGNFTWFTQTAQLDILILLAILCVGVAASLLQWQRLEA